MKNSLLTFLLIIPILSFGQLSINEKKEIDIYSTNLCSCVEEIISELGSTMKGYIDVLIEKGEVDAGQFITKTLENATEEKVNQFIADADKMQSPEFLARIENCENYEDLQEKSIAEINNEKGESYDYLIKLLSDKDFCRLTKMLYILGAK